jgi:hypothetical protein
MRIPRRWKYAIVFWGLYILAIVFYRRYPWLDFAWMLVSGLVVLGLSVYLVQQKIHYGGDKRIHARSPLGYPRWLNDFLRDDRSE